MREEGVREETPATEQADLVTAIKGVLEQETPKNLFYFTREKNGFDKEFQRHYEAIWRRWLGSTARVLREDGILELDKAETRTLENYRKKLFDLDYMACTRETGFHHNGEIKIKCGTNVRKTSVDVMFFIGSDVNESMMELFLTGDMLVRAGADEINLYAPFIPYMREDKKDEGRVPLSGKLVFDLMEAACKGKLQRIVTADLHAPQEQGFPSVPVDNIIPATFFARYLNSEEFYKKTGVQPKDITLLSPDAGGAKRTSKVAKLLGTEYAIFDKRRPKTGETEIDDNSPITIKTPYVAYIEDMIDTATTLAESGEWVKERFNLEGAFALATHGIFSPKKDEKGKILSTAEEKLRKAGIKVIVTDSIPRSDSWYQANSDWLINIISLAEPFANIALNNRLGHSVSEYMDKQYRRVREAVENGQRMEMSDYLVKIAPERKAG